MLTAGGGGAIVYRRTGDADEIDAIDEYSRRLVRALGGAGLEARYVPGGLSSAIRATDRPSWVLLQYNPFRYGRWGFAPRLVSQALRLKRSGGSLAIMVHEAWCEPTDARWALVGTWQRHQLRALMHLADVVMTSTEALSRELGHGARHVPVASNVTRAATTPAAARVALGLHDDLVVTTFGRAHPSRALGFAAAAIDAIAASRGPVRMTVLNLGADAPALHLTAAVDARTPGPLSEHDLSLHLLATDILLLPFTDGASTRRGTVMAALAHGRATVGLSSRNTDTVLLEHPEALTLTPTNNIDAFVRAALALAGDPDRRRAAGDASQRLYEAEFDWPHVARRVITAIEPTLPRRSTPVAVAAGT